MRFAFIDAEKAHYPVTVLCRVMEVKPQRFYAWLHRGGRVCEHVMTAFCLRTFGLRFRAVAERMGALASAPSWPAWESVPVSAASRGLMRAGGLYGATEATICAHHRLETYLPIAPNLLQRDFTVSAPNRVWATDITYLWTTGAGCIWR